MLTTRLAPDSPRGVQIDVGGRVDDDDGGGSGGARRIAGSAKRATRIVMDFPIRTVREVSEPADRRAIVGMLRKAFPMIPDDGVADVDGEGAGMSSSTLFVGMDDLGEDVLVELTRDAFLSVGYQGIRLSALSSWGGGYTRGVILCCRSNRDRGDDEDGDDDVDFLSRFFGPKVGIDEDPVTGSAHCALGPYFGSLLGKDQLVGRQVSQRGGIVG